MERIEQKVRVQFCLQRAQPRLRELSLELDGVQRARLRFAVVRKRVAQADDRRIRHQRPVHVGQEDPLTESEPVESRVGGDRGPQRQPNAEQDGEVQQREAEGGHRMGRQRPAPARRVEPEPMRYSEDGAGHGRGHVPVGEVQHQQAEQIGLHRLLHVECREPVGLERREDPEEGRDGKHPAYGRRPGFLHQFHYLV